MLIRHFAGFLYIFIYIKVKGYLVGRNLFKTYKLYLKKKIDLHAFGFSLLIRRTNKNRFSLK